MFAQSVPARYVHTDDVTDQQVRRGLVVTLTADGDMTDCQAVVDLLTDCRDAMKSLARQCVIDLASVSQADTKLVACLVSLHRLAHDMDIDLIVRVSHPVRRVLEVCRLGHLIHPVSAN